MIETYKVINIEAILYEFYQTEANKTGFYIINKKYKSYSSQHLPIHLANSFDNQSSPSYKPFP